MFPFVVRLMNHRNLPFAFALRICRMRLQLNSSPNVFEKIGLPVYPDGLAPFSRLSAIAHILIPIPLLLDFQLRNLFSKPMKRSLSLQRAFQPLMVRRRHTRSKIRHYLIFVKQAFIGNSYIFGRIFSSRRACSSLFLSRYTISVSSKSPSR